MFSPAKINIGLRVGTRRPTDGLHRLESVFVAIDFGDDLDVEIDDGVGLRLISENLLPPESPARGEFEAVSERGNPSGNILQKTYSEFSKEIGGGCAVRLKKRIPTGAGLGGGSSNAGVMIRQLADRIRLDDSELTRRAMRIGADVPFFLQDGVPMLVGGAGETRTPVKVAPGRGVLAVTGRHVPTKEAYLGLKRPLQESPDPEVCLFLEPRLLENLAKGRWSGLEGLKNDFEGVIFAQYPELSELKRDFLQFGAEYASMTGSGSALYGLVDSPAQQARLSDALREKHPKVRFHNFQLRV